MADRGRAATAGPAPLRAALLLAGLVLYTAAPARGLDPVAATPPAPSLELVDMSGEAHDLARYRGRVVLVNFWATWCLPCIQELPSMRRLGARLAEQPFALLAVNAGEGKSRVFRFLGTIGTFDAPVLLDPRRSAYGTWHVKGLPTSYLIDAEGRMRYRVTGAVDWDNPAVVAPIERLLEEARRDGEAPR